MSTVYTAACVLRKLLLAFFERGGCVHLDKNTGEVLLEPAGLLNREEQAQLFQYHPELVAMVHGLVWEKRLERVERHYHLNAWLASIGASEQRLAHLVERFEAKHGPLKMNLSEELRSALAEAPLDDCIANGWGVARDLVKRLEKQRTEHEERVRQGMAELLGFSHADTASPASLIERHNIRPNPYDPGLLDMLADLGEAARF